MISPSSTFIRSRYWPINFIAPTGLACFHSKRVLRRSGGLGARIEAAALPRSAAILRQHEALQLECLLAGGDDYELLFSADPADRDTVSALAARAGCGVTRIGTLGAAGTPLEVVDADGRPLATAWASFDHFLSR